MAIFFGYTIFFRGAEREECKTYLVLGLFKFCHFSYIVVSVLIFNPICHFLKYFEFLNIREYFVMNMMFWLLFHLLCKFLLSVPTMLIALELLLSVNFYTLSQKSILHFVSSVTDLKLSCNHPWYTAYPQNLLHPWGTILLNFINIEAEFWVKKIVIVILNKKSGFLRRCTFVYVMHSGFKYFGGQQMLHCMRPIPIALSRCVVWPNGARQCA